MKQHAYFRRPFALARRISRSLTLLLAAWILASTPALGLDVYSTGFENPPFLAGSVLQGLDGWTAGAFPFLNPTSATITAATAVSGTQSLQIPGAAMVTFVETAPYAAASPQYHIVNFDATAAGLPIVKVRADVRIDGPSQLTPDSSFAVSIAAVPSEGRYSELVLASNGVLYGLSSFGPEVVIQPVGNPLNAWHSLEIKVDFSASAYTLKYDTTSFGPFPFAASIGPDQLLRGSIVTYALPDDPGVGFARADYTARVDNFSITAVPEPGSFVLAATAVAGLFGPISRRSRMS
jgi:hypothetical protein